MAAFGIYIEVFLALPCVGDRITWVSVWVSPQPGQHFHPPPPKFIKLYLKKVLLFIQMLESQEAQRS